MSSGNIKRIQLQAEHATLSFLAWSQYQRLFGRTLKVEHSLGDGLFCEDEERQEITEEMAKRLADSINEILNSDAPENKIELIDMPRDELVSIFTSKNQQDKVGVLKTWQDDTIHCIKCGNTIDYCVEPMSVDKERLKIFDIHVFVHGIVLRYPILTNPNALSDWKDPQVLYDMFQEYRRWAQLIGIEYVYQLNQAIYDKKVNQVKWVAEGLHDSKLADIADHLCANFSKKRIITIAGPSSSNKTTFAKRLAIQLRVNGYNSMVIEMDDYFKNNSEVPFGPDGLQDFEHISALNVELLSERVKQLLDGKTIPRRRFLFKQGGIGVDSDKEEENMKLGDRMFLILEGIHGLNPILLDLLGREKVTPIYVSALTPLNIDANHRFPTTILRLIRRMVRDYRFRGHSPRKTLQRWTSVRMGEERNIFPYQGNAELYFNSALVYELPILSIYAKGLLAEASVPGPDEDPNSEEAQNITQEALRVLGLLNFFYPVSTEIVPHISCIREFVGGSDLKY